MPSRSITRAKVLLAQHRDTCTTWANVDPHGEQRAERRGRKNAESVEGSGQQKRRLRPSE